MAEERRKSWYCSMARKISHARGLNFGHADTQRPLPLAASCGGEHSGVSRRHIRNLLFLGKAPFFDTIAIAGRPWLQPAQPILATVWSVAVDWQLQAQGDGACDRSDYRNRRW